MKRVNLLLPAIIIILLACNQKKDSSVTGNRDGTDTTRSEPANISAEAVEEKQDALAKMAPLSEQEMKALLPMELMGASKTDEDVNSAIGTATASADYRINDSTSFELTIIDCAGPGGAGIYNIQYAAMLGLSEEDEEEYTRTVDFNGGRAFENCSKTQLQCNLTWFTSRFLVSLDGNLPASKLKEIASGLKL